MQIYEDISLVELGNLLKDKIKNRKDLFTDIDIIVPNDKVEQWFKSFWLMTESEVLMNVRFFNIEDGLLKLFKTSKQYKIARRSELRTHIIEALARIDNKLLDKNVSDYIYENDKLDSIRLYDLSNTLSKLFIEYDMQNVEIVGWQKLIYDYVLEELDKKNKTTFKYVCNNKLGFSEVDEVIFLGFSTFDNIYEHVINELNLITNVVIYKISDDINTNIIPKLMTAPSKMREIELIHSQICKLVQEKDVKYSDILVLCPELSKYEIEISKVFNQDNENFPSIPYSINDSTKQESDVTSGLKKLFEIASKGFYTRLDFTDIINNKIIQLSRGITSDDIENWEHSIIEMNVYRNGKRIDDWDYAKKRVVLSKVASINDIDENIVELSSGKYMPFSNIDFSDDSIVRFASIIDDLNIWIEEFNTHSIATKEKVELLLAELTKWFSIVNFDGFESNKIFRRIADELSLWREFELTKIEIPLNTLFYNLFDLSESSKFNASKIYVEGVSFVDYEENVILPSKYLFILGLSSNQFPKKKNISEIDLRNELVDNGISSFITQCNNASYLYLSYVNHNLKTDEEFYPSTYILKLYEKLNLNVNYYKQIAIDETREWIDLFTKKEYKEKDYYYGLFSNTESLDDELPAPKKEMMKKVSVSQMKRFLTEPLKYKAEYLFGYEDETMDLLSDEYEPFTLDYLNNYILVKSVISYLLKNPDCELIDEDNEIDIDLAYRIFERFIIEHKIPNINSEIEQASIENVCRAGFAVTKKILEVTNGKYEITKISDVKFDVDGDEIVLYYNDELCLSVDDNERKYIEISDGGDKPSSLLNMYICSLMDVSTLSNDEYKIKLYRGDGSTQFIITPTDAYDKLIEIYIEMNNYEMNAYMPIDIVEKNLSFQKLILNAMGDNGGWSFFKGKEIFDQYKDLGYNEFNYQIKSSEMKNLLQRLVIYLKKEEA